MLVVGNYWKTMKGLFEYIKFRQLLADKIEVKRKEIEDSDFKTFWYWFPMKKKVPLLIIIFTLMSPVYSCPINGQDKDQLLSELCNIDNGNWESNRLNEMIILAKYGKLPLKGTTKGNRELASLTCN